MSLLKHESLKICFKDKLSTFVERMTEHISTEDGQWTIKGFVDVLRNVYTISTDTKVVSKILEIHLFPMILDFAVANNYRLVLAGEQNHYPDLSFVEADNEDIKFAVDLKTTYRVPERPEFCKGFTLGSHGEYFTNRTSTKNITFPYGEYLGHFCLGIIYSRAAVVKVDETKICGIDDLESISSVVQDFQFFVREKWEIASDRQGSHNTANIGSITRISDILDGNGVFKHLGEKWFDDYWINYNKITVAGPDGKTRKIRNLRDFLIYRGQDPDLANSPSRRRPKGDASPAKPERKRAR